MQQSNGTEKKIESVANFGESFDCQDSYNINEVYDQE